MDKRKQKKVKRLAAAYIPTHRRPVCPNCGQVGAHYVPPSFGEAGFYACETVEAAVKRITDKAFDDPDFVVAGQDELPPGL